ncbi:Bax inhibitor-1 family protein [Haloarcula onubensis]|uniref:Bax inhibitor-1 family protein n=1 Tax=Haloarcula onubensis TaxID=2950539 RepID=A0ABU2FT58_9EURY|nr:Bax inhibitor-1 family protein [Halomicroarcula sp. S3CR25-11]MDS0283341.1 Bax inhibitor-1 family protein [Halomicroarcula sp. S3CR25-11]
MSGSFGRETVQATGTVDRNLTKIIGMATGLIAVNILAMLALSYVPPVVGLGSVLFGNFFIGIAVFAVTVGGGSWVASKGTKRGSLPLAGAGLTLTQVGYALFGATVLGLAAASLRVPAIGIAVVVTAALTAAVAAVVFTTEKDFSSWQSYSFYLFVGGFAVGAVAFFVAPALILVASLVFFAAFVVSLTYEIWAVKENRYASDLRNAIGIYVAVMGVFVNVLVWVLRILELLDA